AAARPSGAHCSDRLAADSPPRNRRRQTERGGELPCRAVAVGGRGGAATMMELDSEGWSTVDLEVARAYARNWWLFLLCGGLWLLLGFVILSMRPASISVCALLIALAFWLGAFTMFTVAAVTDGGWRITAMVGGIVAIAAGVAALVWPEPTLRVLGVFVAWYL